MSMTWQTGDDDFELRPIEPDDLCDYCEALDTEPHKDDCPLFFPLCACGASARRYISGQPVCAICQRSRLSNPDAVARGSAVAAVDPHGDAARDVRSTREEES